MKLKKIKDLFNTNWETRKKTIFIVMIFLFVYFFILEILFGKMAFFEAVNEISSVDFSELMIFILISYTVFYILSFLPKWLFFLLTTIAIIVISSFLYLPGTAIQYYIRGYMDTKHQVDYQISMLDNAELVLVGTSHDKYTSSGYSSNNTDFNILKYLDIQDNNQKMVNVAMFNEDYSSFYDSVVKGEIIYYLKHKKKILELYEYNLNNKVSNLLDVWEHEHDGIFYYGDGIKTKLFLNKDELIWYFKGSIRKYDLADDKKVSESLLIPNKFNIDKNGFYETNYDEDTYFILGDIASIFFEDNILSITSKDLGIKKDSQRSTSSLCFKRRNSGYGDYPGVVKCDLESNKCKMECVKDEHGEIYAEASGQRYPIVKLNDNEIIHISNKKIHSVNCGGYFQIGKCRLYSQSFINIFNGVKSREVYSYVSSIEPNGHIGHMIISKDNNYIVYSLSGYKNIDTYLLDIRGGNKPKLLAKNAYPIFFNVKQVVYD
ncbi:MAG: hypothetical protein KAI16_00250 [Candidatus Pacebacteria bacterium]|nr:hypothetical protein [Candidatus Paceibacterota bacterium]